MYRALLLMAIVAGGCGGSQNEPTIVPAELLDAEGKPDGPLATCNAVHFTNTTDHVSCQSFALVVTYSNVANYNELLEAYIERNVYQSSDSDAEIEVRNYPMSIAGHSYIGRKFHRRELQVTEASRSGFVLVGPGEKGETLSVACFSLSADVDPLELESNCRVAMRAVVATGIPQELFDNSTPRPESSPLELAGREFIVPADCQRPSKSEQRVVCADGAQLSWHEKSTSATPLDQIYAAKSRALDQVAQTDRRVDCTIDETRAKCRSVVIVDKEQTARAVLVRAVVRQHDVVILCTWSLAADSADTTPTSAPPPPCDQVLSFGSSVK